MLKTVGIPKALLYYEYSPMWRTFFESLGLKVIFSADTNKKILEKGIGNSVDDTCLPVKVAMGHVIDLAPRADYIFLPRMVSIAPGEYICPKFMGFPDMVRYYLPEVQLIDVNLNLYRHRSQEQKMFRHTGKIFSKNPLKINKAYQEAKEAHDRYNSLLTRNFLPGQAMDFLHRKIDDQEPGFNDNGPTIALIGHSYNIYDSYISMDIIQNLKNRGINIVTPDNLSIDTMRDAAGALPKKLFWTLGQKMIGAALHFMKDPKISGIIYVVSFGCGPDSMVGELIERYLYREGDIPFLKLTLDEHTGEAGLITRLEAFLDMVEWKAGDKFESNFSTHG